MYAFEFAEVGPIDDVLRGAAHPYTRALLRSVPSLGSSFAEMETVKGESPDPVNMPQGCSYAPRCPIAEQRCSVEDPALRETDGKGHEAACFYWEQSEDEIAYSLDSGFWGGR
jgi:oligopeptide/dipeptide ABC transporter ATP-binding protein